MYTITDITKLTHISTRTLRYYDELNLLTPTTYSEAGYRLYDESALERLHRILLYKQFGFSLKVIQQIIDEDHLLKTELLNQKKRVEQELENLKALKQNITLKLKELDGVYTMTDKDRFELFKTELIERNESQFGEELRETYGHLEIERSNEKIKKSTKDDFEHREAAEAQLVMLLEEAQTKGIEGVLGQEIVRVHKQWLMYSWTTYNAEMHRSIALMYVTDERFKQYYEAYGKGFADLLYRAIERHADRL